MPSFEQGTAQGLCVPRLGGSRAGSSSTDLPSPKGASGRWAGSSSADLLSLKGKLHRPVECEAWARQPRK